MMKILWLGVFDGKQWRAEYQVLRAFKRAKIDVLPVNMRSCGQLNALKKQLLEGWDDFNLVLIQNGKHFNPSWLQLFSKPAIYWATEAQACHARPYIYNDKPPTFILANSVQTMKMAKAAGVPAERLHNGYDPSLYFSKQCRTKYDVAMLGTMTARRRFWYKETVKALGRDAVFNVTKHYSAQTANDIYNASKIVLHVHAIGETYLPSRYFEALPTQGCLLIEKMGGNYDERMGGGHFVQFEDRNDMIKKIRQILMNERLRRDIVRKANLEAPKHTWDARVRQMKNIVQRVLL